jgi:hypothetical protein
MGGGCAAMAKTPKFRFADLHRPIGLRYPLSAQKAGQ